MEIFDRFGNSVGNVDDQSGCGCLIGIGVIVGILYLIVEVINITGTFLVSHASHPFPYNFVAAFYYYCGLLVSAPFRAAFYCHSIITDGNLTPYINVNRLLGLVVWLILAFSPFVVMIYIFTKSRLREYKGVVILGLLLPAVAGLLWFLISSFITWISIKSA